MIVLLHNCTAAETRSEQAKTLAKHVIGYLSKQQETLDEDISQDRYSRACLHAQIVNLCSEMM